MNSTRICRLSLWMLGLSLLLTPERALAQFCGGCCCFGRSITLTEYANEAEILVVAKWVHGIPKKDSDPGATEFQVVTVIRQPGYGAGEDLLEDQCLEPVNRVHSTDRVGLHHYRAGNPDDLVLLSGSLDEGRLQWDSALEITPAALRYYLDAPPATSAVTDRLRYSVRFIDSSDDLIAEDAFRVLEDASYQDLKVLGSEFPRLKLRKLLMSSSTPADRLGLCCRLLGIYGSEKDAEFLERHMFANQAETSPDHSDVLIGYLLLKGERGLAVLEEKLKDQEIEFDERDVVLSAMRYVARDTDRIPRERMIQSIRLALDDIGLAESAILDLMHLKDWDVQDQLVQLFQRDEFEFTTLRLAVTRFLLAASTDVDDNEPLPRRVVRAKQHLRDITEQHPELIDEANEFAQLEVIMP